MSKAYTMQHRDTDRQAVLAAIVAKPGIKSDKLQQQLNISRGSLLTALRELLDAQHITQPKGRKSGYFKA